MGATPEDTEREIVRLRGDMSAAVEEVEHRLRGGMRSVATAEARISGASTMSSEIVPIDDIRSTRDYRLRVSLNLLQDFLARAVAS